MAKVERWIWLISILGVLVIHSGPSIQGSLSEKPHLSAQPIQEEKAFDKAHTPHKDFLKPPQACEFVQPSSPTTTLGSFEICQPGGGVVVVTNPSAQTEKPPYSVDGMAFIMVILCVAVLRIVVETSTALSMVKKGAR